MRVSLVRLDDDEVWFAPHDHRAWLVLKAGESLGEEELEVGQVGYLEVDGESWLFEVDPTCRIELVRLAVGGGRDVVAYRLGRDREHTDLSGHGVELDLRYRAARLGFWRLTSSGSGVTTLGHFNHPNLAAWCETTRTEMKTAEQEETRRRQVAERRRQREQAADFFVNPYTFVPFPEQAANRKRPGYHHRLASDRFSGRIKARLVARSPLLIRQIGSQAPASDTGVALAPRDSDGKLFIPGSSLHGALRALHETLTGSCLRVFDADFVPAYRDVASMERRKGWRLGVVQAVSDRDGRPTEVVVCSDNRLVRLHALVKALPTGQAVTTGQRFTLDSSCFVDHNGRSVYDDEAPITHDDVNGEWVVLVTDPSARPKKDKKTGAKKSYYCAVGRLPSGTASAPTAEVSGPAWDAFQAAVAGAKYHFKGESRAKLVEERARLAVGDSLADVLGVDEKGDARSTDFCWESEAGEARGRWLRPRPWLHPGQVVWIAPPRGGITNGIALSYLWRTVGAKPARDRLPDDRFLACHEPGDLCPSCRIFGSADLAEDISVDRRQAQQHSYRGHVRVLDAAADQASVLDPVTLPVLGTPHPGSGQFYLDDNGTDATDPPRNRWGSPADGRSRLLRGRKAYWHTDPAVDERRGRWKWHPDHAPNGGDRAELVTTGSSYHLDIWFDGLTRAEIGGLIATLQPELLFKKSILPYSNDDDPPPQFAIHVGGGKPLGLGSCQVKDLELDVDNATSRYLGGIKPAFDLVTAVDEFASEPDRVKGHWPALATALHVEHVDSRIVSYPTVVPWADDDGTCTGKAQHESFEWFQRTTGEQLEGENERAFTPLPPVTSLAQGLPVDAGTR
jgi:CRISPR-associated protein (TIGR03986 family)